MSMLEVHKEAKESTTPIFHEFIGRYRKNNKTVYGFVEGKEDPSFYRGFIEHTIPNDWSVELWPSGNKDKVIELFREFDWKRFSRNRIIFFLDKDLSDFIGEALPNEPNLYITDQYSIENDISNASTFARVITEVCNIQIIKEKEILIDLFEKEKRKFLNFLITVMAWILWWKRSGKRPYLNDIEMKHLFKFSEAELSINPNPKGSSSWVEYIHSQCNIIYDNSVDLSGIEMELRFEEKFIKFTRGKYIFWFFVEFVLSVHRNISKIIPAIKESPKMHITFSQSNGMVLVAPRARIPESLKIFLESTYCNYINGVEDAA